MWFVDIDGSREMSGRVSDFFKDVYQTLFRFVRFPCKTELAVIGVPNRASPILVTCNFDYTVRGLKKYLIQEKIDCYLAVVNTNGTNVWCAAVEGEMDSDTVLAHLKVHKAEDLVEHKKLVLPQLSAAGVKRRDLKEQGWEGVYGPVYFKDLKAFLSNDFKRSNDMQVLEYRYWERFKMAVSHGVFCTMVCMPFVLVLFFDAWLFGLLAIWYFALVMQLFEHFLPIERLLYKGMVFSLPLIALAYSSSQGWGQWLHMSSLCFALGAYIGFDSQGHSHFGQTQKSSGRLMAALFVALVLYGGSFLL